MAHPVESFVIALARASKRGSHHLRGLKGADRDDVIANALAWCWEHRAQYTPAITLEAWFDGALQESRSRWYGRGRRKKTDAVVTAEGFNELMSTYLPDPTAEAAEAEEIANQLLSELDPMDRAQMYLIARGLGDASPELQRRLNRLSKLVPDRIERIKVIRATVKPSSDAVTGSKAPAIDRELAALSGPRDHAADCPVCWRCSWYEHLVPKRYAKRVTTPADPEVQAAIWATEERKIEIATRLQAGTMQFIGSNHRSIQLSEVKVL